jgi:hypothetical protein
LTYTPAPHAFGTATITVTLSDNGGTLNSGANTSAPQSFVINVNSVNDVPSFTKGADQSIAMNAGPQTVVGWATALSKGPPNESGQTLSFNVTGNSNPSLFSAGPSIAANGTLTYTTAPGAFGTATITLTLSDNGTTANGGSDTSAPQSFVINVNGDLTPPTVVITPPVVGVSPIVFVVTFSEPISGFTASDLNVINGIAAQPIAGANNSFTVNVTPNGRLIVSLSLPAGTVTDLAGNALAVGSNVAQGNYHPSDVNRDGRVDIDDILVAVFVFVENRANLPIPVANLPPGPPFPDANQDDYFDLDDILQIIFDRVQFLANPEGEGESSSAASVSGAETADIATRDALFADATEEAAAAWFAPPTKVRKLKA